MSIRPATVGLIIFISICLLVATAGSLIVNTSIHGWYEQLQKPAWTPPNWVFPMVWTTLYLLMGIAAWLVWRKHGLSGGFAALVVFYIQLTLNLLWSCIFFGLQMPGMAFVELLLLWIAILITLILFWRAHRIAGLLMSPYLLWVTFAAAINYQTWQMNL